MVYLAKVDSALTTTVTGVNWFKIHEDGTEDNSTWTVIRLYNNKGSKIHVTEVCTERTASVSVCIAQVSFFGLLSCCNLLQAVARLISYLSDANSHRWSSPSLTAIPWTDTRRYLRAENVALHAASSHLGEQLCVKCAHIAVTGGGNGSSSTVSFQGKCKGMDLGSRFSCTGQYRQAIRSRAEIVCMLRYNRGVKRMEADMGMEKECGETMFGWKKVMTRCALNDVKMNRSARLLAQSAQRRASLDIQPPERSIQLLRLPILQLLSPTNRSTRPIQQPLLLRPSRSLCLHVLRLEDMHPAVQPARRNPPLLRQLLLLPPLLERLQGFARVALEFGEVFLERCAGAEDLVWVRCLP
jgi:hypothetical protein